MRMHGVEIAGTGTGSRVLSAPSGIPVFWVVKHTRYGHVADIEYCHPSKGIPDSPYRVVWTSRARNTSDKTYDMMRNRFRASMRLAANLAHELDGFA